jgi:hypothetical protein
MRQGDRPNLRTKSLEFRREVGRKDLPATTITIGDHLKDS